MPQRHFLTASESLCQQVANFLMRSAGEGPPDLSTTLVITPTAGAARHINDQLKAAGFKPPASAQPMQALLPESERIASSVERCLAWSEALQSSSPGELQALFWRALPATSNELLKAGRKFCHLCDQLAEAALSPNTFTLPKQLLGSFDEGRWQAIASLYNNYLTYLKRWDLEDPNELRLLQIEQPKATFARMVIVGVADLPTATEHYAANIEMQGTPVELLIWNPGNAPAAHFDTWGRPLPDEWNARPLELNPDQIKVCASTRDEARLTAATILKDPSSKTAGLVVADPKLHSTLAGEILACGRRPYRPEGDPLIRGEAATLALEWEEFRLNKDLSRLRRLLELPAFCRALNTESSLSQSEALIAIDQLLGLTIAATLDAARATTASSETIPAFRSKDLARIRRLLSCVQARLQDSSLDLLELAFSIEEERPRSVASVLEIGRGLEASAAIKNWSQRGGSTVLPVQVFAQALRAEQIQSTAAADDVVLNGWLEAAWLPQRRLHISGMVDGCLPQSVDGDPFLPDSIRPGLGLSHNNQRQARDAYLLDCLLQSKGPEELTLSYSKYNHEGDPNRPSRLLLRTELEALPKRVQHVLAPQASTRVRPKRHTDWRWRIPGELPQVTKVSPTQFKSYLECPFRFCLEKILKLETGPTAAREMDAAVFGNLIHRTLESFGKRVIPMQEKMLQLDEPTIREWVQQELEKEAKRQFGSNPAPAVRVQLANAASRLNAFARKQAECFAEGWMIRQVEEKLEADGEHPLMIGPLALSGMIDRIEQHLPSGALRILDYKTFSTLKKPAQTHFGPAARNWLPAAHKSSIGRQSDDSAALILLGGKQRAWTDLQLPLYRRILEHWYPEETAQHLPEVAYFVLPSDPNESGIYRFDELNEADHYAAALACAETVAASIAAGVFWPPQPFRGSWDDPLAPLFVNGAPDQCIDRETITQLTGVQ
jgi:ATP-dependent helicase/nuclease subunit B